jgi:trigger factor
MHTTVTELPESRVRVQVDVDPREVERRVKQTAGRLGREMRVPGFRQGKVPPEIVLQRLGRETVLSETLEAALGEWYERALVESGINPVGDPRVDLRELPGEGEPLRFSIEVGVRPHARLGDYRGLEVGRPEAEVPPEAVQAELERLRGAFATLRPVDREARQGDVLLIDYRGEIDGAPFEGGEARDYLLELGAGQVLEDFERPLGGSSAGRELQVEVRFPPDYRPEHLAGKTASFAITVKEVREKELPELDDQFAAEASEFDTLAELREHLEGRIREVLERRAEERFREAALDAAVEQASVELPDAIVDARAAEMWHRLERSLSERGVSSETYLRMQGKTREQILAEAKPDAEQALRREAVLEAVAEAEGIEVGDEELVAALSVDGDHGPEHDHDHQHPSGEQLLERLRSTGRDSLLRDELRMRRALDLIAAEARPIPIERAEARERLWTPEKEREGEQKPGLWTPGAE